MFDHCQHRHQSSRCALHKLLKVHLDELGAVCSAILAQLDWFSLARNSGNTARSSSSYAWGVLAQAATCLSETFGAVVSTGAGHTSDGRSLHRAWDGIAQQVGIAVCCALPVRLSAGSVKTLARSIVPDLSGCNATCDCRILGITACIAACRIQIDPI